MRLRRSRGFHGLKRPKLRQSWSKINLYNISRYQTPVNQSQTYFQQKWKAKSASRKYHGDAVGEKKWERLFRPTIRSVVSMDPALLARGDGRQDARGRGSGLERPPADRGQRKPLQRTPYMHMAFAQLERRLDTAVFRAMFASSTRQARQFCVHGAVKVNGQKMIYPGYQLNPGDMFQVEPERVLFATGARKDRSQRTLGRKARKARDAGEDEAAAIAPKRKNAAEPEQEQEPEDAAGDLPTDSKAVLQQLLATAKSAATLDSAATAKQKQDLRTFTRLVRSTLSRSGSGDAAEAVEVPASTADQLSALMERLNIAVEPASAAEAKAEKRSSQAAKDVRDERGRVKPTVPLGETQMIKTHERRQLAEALAAARDNPLDPAKPYATPWRPRPWMSAFAFIPRYLEVHHRVCSAVYLRHPVARPGLAEVPTPFDAEVMGLSFNWYLRRR